MPSIRRRASVLDADRTPEPVEETTSPAKAEALALAEEAEAEAAEADALAAAARARARAIRLRREAASAGAAAPNGRALSPAEEPVEEDVAAPDADVDDDTDTGSGAGTDADAIAPAPEEPARGRMRLRRPRLRRPGWKAVAASVALLCTAALLVLSTLMIVSHRRDDRQAQLAAEFDASARQAVVTLMSLNFNSAKDDVQRIIDNSTGDFKKEFEDQATDFSDVAQESKVVTEVNVKSSAVESIADADNGVVLVAAESKVTNAAGAQQDPRAWRLSVNLQRDGGQLKMSKVEFVP